MIVSVRAFGAATEVWAWLFGRRRRIRVEGESMLPTLHPGEFVLADPNRAPVVGDVIVADHPSQPMSIVKRVTTMDDDGRLVLASDNPVGVDSTDLGPIDPAAVTGVVTIVLDRPGARLGRRPR